MHNPRIKRGGFVFSLVEKTPPPVSSKNFVSVSRVVSKTTAKHDRKAARYCRVHSVKPKVLDATGLFSAGLVSRY